MLNDRLLQFVNVDVQEVKVYIHTLRKTIEKLLR